MATATTSAPVAAGAPPGGIESSAVPLAEVSPQPASLLPPEGVEPLALGGAAARFPVELDVSIEVRGFRVRHLLVLAPGQIVETTWTHGEDVPLAAGQVQLAWAEFEVVDTQLAVRITRLP